ncbi:hypothetical protein H9655_13515 [Cytobacillus sp. Sa5YUA1]|uniref:Intracellular proteinase inhibitor BsuPI domain-containing protein n=1 Tax=Cytobacillus stercorigallinarum TaxID=2762240 RepID=A0ABR8QR83_9BACI|nr:BsuPI-related putative proteinase inhibitor [Cytobacillus stercorigallinarum]MBD7938045.1 hypothetical protein [Cytobacillus stercorigallinarum]
MLHLLLSAILATNFLPQQSEMEANKHMDIQFEVQAVSEEKLVLTFTVHNQTNELVKMQFNTSQKYDYEVLDEHGKVVYRYSDGKAFLQMIQTENLSLGEKKEWKATWDYQTANEGTINPGSYKVQATFLGQVIEPEGMEINQTSQTTFTYGKDQLFNNITVEGKDGAYHIKGHYKGQLPVIYSVEDGHFLLVKEKPVQVNKDGDFNITVKVNEEDLPKSGSLIAYLSEKGSKGKPIKLQSF